MIVLTKSDSAELDVFACLALHILQKFNSAVFLATCQTVIFLEKNKSH